MGTYRFAISSQRFPASSASWMVLNPTCCQMISSSPRVFKITDRSSPWYANNCRELAFYGQQWSKLQVVAILLIGSKFAIDLVFERMGALRNERLEWDDCVEEVISGWGCVLRQVAPVYRHTIRQTNAT